MTGRSAVESRDSGFRVLEVAKAVFLLPSREKVPKGDEGAVRSTVPIIAKTPKCKRFRHRRDIKAHSFIRPSASTPHYAGAAALAQAVWWMR